MSSNPHIDPLPSPATRRDRRPTSRRKQATPYYSTACPVSCNSTAHPVSVSEVPTVLYVFEMQSPMPHSHKLSAKPMQPCTCSQSLADVGTAHSLPAALHAPVLKVHGQLDAGQNMVALLWGPMCVLPAENAMPPKWSTPGC